MEFIWRLGGNDPVNTIHPLSHLDHKQHCEAQLSHLLIRSKLSVVLRQQLVNCPSNIFDPSSINISAHKPDEVPIYPAQRSVPGPTHRQVQGTCNRLGIYIGCDSNWVTMVPETLKEGTDLSLEGLLWFAYKWAGKRMPATISPPGWLREEGNDWLLFFD